MKRFLTLLLAFFMINWSFLPAASVEAGEKCHKKEVVQVEFTTYLDANKVSKGEHVQFLLSEDYTDSQGNVIPKGTLFNGKIKSVKHSRWAYRRAKVRIVIDEMVYPTGEKQAIHATTARRVLKGSALRNVGKGVITAPIAVVVGLCGSVVIVVESISIVGILLVGPTAVITKDVVGALTKGVNFTKGNGDTIKIRIK